MTSSLKRVIRCAIYTRKSSEEGLEQDFNSLDAQREACAAYIASQASEGWTLLPEHYDDGGISGGTLERPSLQRLLADVKEGRVDIIVVYKVDRLTRSLLDFAKLVEAFDEAEVSFVSVTQSFNTTTSMGRLTLNMLLSFAQFEREVTAERIRDKIAQSKAKGMWMGGTPPLGYEPDGRNSLTIIDEHAAMIRDIYARYLRLGTVRLVADELEAENIRTPIRATKSGKTFGGCLFTRGQLYQILRNPTYAGDIPHKGEVHPGNHKPIIERDRWEAVQMKLADHVRGTRRTREASTALLAGKLFDDTGEALIPVHTSKVLNDAGEHARRRYLYYVTKSVHHGSRAAETQALRIPAQEIEQAVKRELGQLLEDPLVLTERCSLKLVPAMLAQVTHRCQQLATRAGEGSRAAIRHLLDQVVVYPERIELRIDIAALGAALGVDPDPHAPALLIHKVNIAVKRTGLAVRLVHDSGALAGEVGPDPTLTGLVTRARQWWSELAQGKIDVAKLARRDQVSPSYVTRVVRLAFLAPQVVEALLAGKLKANIDGVALLAT